MSSLPSGTVTFLLTDVERSTPLWEQFPEAMRVALSRHDALIDAGATRHNGVVVKKRGEGDSLFLTFASAVDAARAALALQKMLREEAWPVETPLKVRMALHTGEADFRDEDYYGSAVNRCARIRTTGCGGQVLLSQATAELVRDQLEGGAFLRDLGLHHLKDLQRPERIYQLHHPDWPDDFGPLRSLAAFRHNLPSQLTSFIGREKELVDVRKLLAETRLLTLTGSGGCGKTRLALQTAAEVVDDFANGVWFVELAALTDGNLIARTIAQTLGIADEPNRDPLQTLCDGLRERALLLLLDNCEHLIDAAAQAANALLQACPGVQILATSRKPLNLAGETCWRIPSLPLPGAGVAITVEAALRHDALRLFVERATSARSQFVLTPANLPATIEICRHLGGIPLAIELAAARLNVLTPQQIASRLNDRFKLLVGGRRDVAPRQQTLSALIDWSHDLLSVPERVLLRRLAVFAGGWTLEGVEAVCEWGELQPGDALDLLSSLVDASLVNVEDAGDEGSAAQPEAAPRYRLLETVREYAAKKLEDGAETEHARESHLRYFLAMAEEAEAKLTGAEQAYWLQTLEAEHDNFRAALTWAAGETRLRLACALFPFWYMRSYFSEGISWLQCASGRFLGASVKLCAKAFNALGVLLMSSRRHQEARTAMEEALRLRRESGNEVGVAETLNSLANLLREQNQLEEAERCYNDSLELRRKLEDSRGIAASLNNLGILARERHDLVRAKSCFEESLHFYIQTKDDDKMAATLTNLGVICYDQEDYDSTRQFYKQALTVYQQQKNRRLTAHTLRNLGHVALQQQAFAESLNYFSQSVSMCWELGVEGDVISGLLNIARVLTGRGQWIPTAILLGFVHKQQQNANVLLDVEDQQDFTDCFAAASVAATAETFAYKYAQGQELSLQQVVRYILEGDFDAL